MRHGTTTFHLLTDWPLSKPNRDLHGDQKAATIGGVARSVISSANRKAIWRRAAVPGGLLEAARTDPLLAGLIDEPTRRTFDGSGVSPLSLRTKYLAEKVLLPALLADPAVRERLAALGREDEAACAEAAALLARTTFEVVQKKERKAGSDTAEAKPAAGTKAPPEAAGTAGEARRKTTRPATPPKPIPQPSAPRTTPQSPPMAGGKWRRSSLCSATTS